MRDRNIDDLPDVMTVNQLACFLSITPLTIKRMSKRGELWVKTYWLKEPHKSKRVFLKKDIKTVFLFQQ